MAYERCVRKKLRSLFEYLDHDKDGRITPSCLQSGLIRLQNYSMEYSTKNGTGNCNPEYPQICEYEIEELLRAVPRLEHTLLTFVTRSLSYTHIACQSCIYYITIEITSLFPSLVNVYKMPFYYSTGLSYHIISYHIISYHIISYHIISYHFISYHIISYHIISYHIISYHIISYLILSYLILSYHIISYLIISYHILSYHIIS